MAESSALTTIFSDLRIAGFEEYLRGWESECPASCVITAQRVSKRARTIDDPTVTAGHG